MNFINKSVEELKNFASEYKSAYATADPFPSIYFDDFFNAFHLQQARAELWQWLIVALGSECGEYDDAKSRSNLIAFYEILESLVEAAWIIDQNRKAKNNI